MGNMHKPCKEEKKNKIDNDGSILSNRNITNEDSTKKISQGTSNACLKNKDMKRSLKESKSDKDNDSSLMIQEHKSYFGKISSLFKRPCIRLPTVKIYFNEKQTDASVAYKKKSSKQEHNSSTSQLTTNKEENKVKRNKHPYNTLTTGYLTFS